jgi:hypothetical protein
MGFGCPNYWLQNLGDLYRFPKILWYSRRYQLAIDKFVAIEKSDFQLFFYSLEKSILTLNSCPEFRAHPCGEIISTQVISRRPSGVLKLSPYEIANTKSQNYDR